MTEKKSKRKDIIKNVAIVFLVILLALTFFSNTIMNWSLPEVSGQYAGYGTITNSIRASGTVIANMGYSVTIDETREIRSILIRKGDKVEAGQVIFTLEEGDSAELEAAKTELENMEYQYQLALINSGSTSYSSMELELSDLQADLLEAQEKLKALDAYSDTAGIEEALEKAQKDMQEKQEYLQELENAISGIGEETDTDDANVRAAMEARDAAKAADEEANAYYQDLQAFQADLDAAQSTLIAAEKKLGDLLQKQSEAESDYENKYPLLEAYRVATIRLNNANSRLNNWYSTQEDQEADPEGYADALRELEAAQAEINKLSPVSDEDLSDLSAQIIEYRDDIYYASQELAEARAMMQIVNPEGRQLSEVNLELARTKQRLKETAAALTAAEKALEIATSGRKESMRQEVKAAKEQLAEAQAVLKSASEMSEQNRKYQDAAEQVEQLKKSIQNKNREIENAKKQGSAEQQRNYLELQRQKKEIEKQKELIEKLENRRMGTDVTAKYAGEVTAVNVMVGDKVTPESVLAQIGVEGKGYTMQVSVTNEQARRLNVGDQAKVSNYWWGDIRITLAAIRTDRSNPGQGKVLEFNVDGDVVDGQSLDISIGEHSNSYSLVVPNSAVREDSNGNFILVAVAKSTPLGNRYTATRVDVTVLDKDGYNTALDAGTDYGYQFVITSSTKPLEAGMLVRLAEE